MKHDIYKQPIQSAIPRNLYKSEPIPIKISEGLQLFSNLRKFLSPLFKQFESMDKKLDTLGKKEVIFPEVQKVQIEEKFLPKDVVFPEVQEVKVNNFPEQKDFPTEIKVSNFPKQEKITIPDEVTVKNQVTIPIGKGNNPRTADPSTYIPVRLTDGDKFYKSLDEMYVATTGKSGGGASQLSGIPKVGQVKIAVTGTPVQLPSNTLLNGVILKAKSTNTAAITVGGSNGLNNTADGTGNGDIIEAGAATSYAVTNTNVLWVNGTADDVISYSGS